MEAALVEILANIQTAAAGLVPILYTLFIAAALDVASGSWAAWVSGSFESKFFLEFIKGHILTKITPIFLLLLAGVSVGGTDSAGGIALVTLGGATASGYLGVVIASIRGNIEQGNNRTKGVPSTVTQPVQVVNTVFDNTSLTDVASPDEV